MDLLLTGASGLLGGELAVALSRRREIERIHCLLRPRADATCAERLRAIFALHGDPMDPDRILPVAGDLLDPDLAERLATDPALARVEIVIHAAANTSFLRANDAVVRATNVGALERLLRWARGHAPLRTFVLVGTAMIRGTDRPPGLVREDEAPDRAARHLVEYTRSKMEAELLLEEALPPERRLVVRPSIILGDSRALVPRSPVVLWAMAALNRLRLLCVDPDAPLDMIPVDHAARTITALLFAEGPERGHGVYHISAGSGGATSARRLAEVLEMHFDDLPPFAWLPSSVLPELRRWLRGHTDGAGALGGYGPYLDHWRRTLGAPRRVLTVLAALEPYLRFMELGHVFDDARIAAATGPLGVERPPPAHVYIAPSMRHLARIDVLRGAYDP